jgi:hypothetical protein
MKRATLIINLLLIGLVSSSCSQTKSKGDKSPAGYDLGNPVKYEMPTELLEISGIAFNQGDNSVVYAEQDEDGHIF